MKTKISLLVLTTTLIFFSLTPSAFGMHVDEGVLPAKQSILWFALALPFFAFAFINIKKRLAIKHYLTPFLGIIGAFVFIISSLHIPLPIGSSEHTTGIGLASILLGPLATSFITMIVLLFQATFLAHGGISTIGANFISMGVVGPICSFFIYKFFRKTGAPFLFAVFSAGITAQLTTYIVTGIQLAYGLGFTYASIKNVVLPLVLPQLTLGVIEGIYTVSFFKFILKHRPDILLYLDVVTHEDFAVSLPANEGVEN